MISQKALRWMNEEEILDGCRQLRKNKKTLLNAFWLEVL